MKKIKHKQFIDDVVGFTSGSSLQQDEPQKKSYSGLAADGEYAVDTDYQKVTTLFNDDGETVIRVFDNAKTGDYDLFIVGEMDTPFCVLYPENSFKYYVFNEKGETVIPKADDVNPCTTNILVSKPKEIFTINTDQLLDEKSSIELKNGNAQLSIGKSGLELELVLNKGNSGRRVSKLIIMTKNDKKTLHWLHPFRLNRASFDLPEDLGPQLYFCFY